MSTEGKGEYRRERRERKRKKRKKVEESGRKWKKVSLVHSAWCQILAAVPNTVTVAKRSVKLLAVFWMNGQLHFVPDQSSIISNKSVSVIDPRTL